MYWNECGSVYSVSSIKDRTPTTLDFAFLHSGRVPEGWSLTQSLCISLLSWDQMQRGNAGSAPSCTDRLPSYCRQMVRNFAHPHHR